MWEIKWIIWQRIKFVWNYKQHNTILKKWKRWKRTLRRRNLMTLEIILKVKNEKLMWQKCWIRTFKLFFIKRRLCLVLSCMWLRIKIPIRLPILNGFRQHYLKSLFVCSLDFFSSVIFSCWEDKDAVKSIHLSASLFVIFKMLIENSVYWFVKRV